MTLLRNAMTALRPTQRAIWVDDNGLIQRSDITIGGTPQSRRVNRTNADVSTTYSAVFAAVRKRSQMASKATFHLMRKNGSAEPIEVMAHPALDALARVNESLTQKQGVGYIAQQKLTFGEAFWIKRRNRLGVPVEFEIWNPERVEVVRRKDRSWAVLEYKNHKDWTTIETVRPEDVIHFRHFLDPRDMLRGLSPIGAVRVQVDTGYEALRFNQRFFDNDAMPAAILSAGEAGKGEVERIRQDFEREFKGTDNKHRMFITEGDLSLTAMPMAHKDMQFLEQMNWNRAEVAAVFEMSPVLIGDTSVATDNNMDAFMTDLWQVVVDDMENVAAELNEFFIHPDFGPEFELTVSFDGIKHLQADELRQAQIDEIELRTGKVIINELRARDSEAPVAWGDIPIVLTTMAPLDLRTGEQKDEAKAKQIALQPKPPMPNGDMPPDAEPPPNAGPPRSFRRSVDDTEADQRRGWERRLQRELRGVIAHLEAANARDIGVDDVGSYDWDWWGRYAEDLMRELRAAYLAALEDGRFVETPLMPAHEVSARYARARAGELLELDGRANVVKATRARVRELVSMAIENGDSIRTLKNALRQDFVFSEGRAESIARTETATAQGKASLMSYSSNGWEGKEWIAERDACEECAINKVGPLPLHASFPSGDDAPPVHPRCRCSLSPVFELNRG